MLNDRALTTKNLLALRHLLDKARGYREFLSQRLPAQRSEITQVVPAARPYVAASLMEHMSAPLLWVTSTSLRAEQLCQDMQLLLGQDWQVMLFPEIDEGTNRSPERLQVLQTLQEYHRGQHDLRSADPLSQHFRPGEKGQAKLAIVAPIAALFRPTLNEERLVRGKLDVAVGDTLDLTTLVELLAGEGYERVTLVDERGTMAIRGGILDVYPLTGQPVRLEFDDDTIAEMRLFDIDTQRTVQLAERATLMPATEGDDPDSQSFFTDILQRVFPDTLVCLEDKDLIMQEAREYYDEWTVEKGDAWTESNGEEVAAHVERLLEPFRQVTVSTWSGPHDSLDAYRLPFTDLPIFQRNIAELLEVLPQWQQENARTIIVSRQAKRLREMMEEADILNVRYGERTDLVAHPLQFGQIWIINAYQGQGWELQLDDGQLRLITDRELTGQRRLRYASRHANSRRSNLVFEDLSVGDYVVHVDYGIGRYEGVFNEDFQGVKCDMLRIAYADGRVFLTVDSIEKLQRYHALKDVEPPLSYIGKKHSKWTQSKAKSLASAKELAEELLHLAAMREQTPGVSYHHDSPWYLDFVQAFPYTETKDQLRAINDVMKDLAAPRPMDRLICGDVGFGKTEVALRAAFAVAIEGKQVAVLVPTTVLAQQHYQTFKERMASFPVHVELLSRVKTAHEQKELLKRLAEGKTDIVVGTHRLLSKDVHFKSLGLIVVDEEHRFGVTHKERLKDLRSNVDVLTMSATPIPRTLQMSLYGIRGLSLIETPPAERLPIKTFLKRRDDELIRVSILRELHREGQVFFLHNRIGNIDLEAKKIQDLVPQARIRVAHGQMKATELEQIMVDFYDGLFDVLISTTIIENGLDIPNVNTIIIDHAHTFGLAQLYQLRGRVGRSTKQGYCYLLIPPRGKISEEAEARLETLRDFTNLGDGYRIARRDMELRGAGDILGARQSGHVTAIGFELYCQMLRDALAEMSGQGEGSPSSSTNDTTQVNGLPIPTGLPDTYLNDTAQKVSFYRRIAKASLEELQEIGAELTDRFGELPAESRNLLDLMAIKRRATELLIAEIKVSDGALHLVMPFCQEVGIAKALTVIQRSRLQAASSGWTPRWNDNVTTLSFYGLFGAAAGKMQYPPAPELLKRLTDILLELKSWQK